jgi:hypothetical protein
MPQWPMYVYMAADSMGFQYDEPDGVAAIEAFATRWGGFDADAMVRAAQRAEGDDWFFAIELLITSAAPHARDVAVTFLDSPDPLKRWYNALYLGVLEDKRAVPILCAMLTEFLPSPQTYQKQRQQQWHYEDVRDSAAYILGRIGDPACIPSLRHALQAVIQVERGQTKPPNGTPEMETIHYQNSIRALRRYQDRIVYALGRLGSLGALTGLQGGEERIPLWRIHLIMGHQHGRYALATMGAFEDEPALVADITDILEQQFGLAATEHEHDMRLYERKMLFMLKSMYQAEQMEQNRHLNTER